MIRINKYLASLGIASRRQIDRMIDQKKIKINDQLAKPGQKIDPQKDKLAINNQIIENKPEQYEYILLNKPKGYLSTTSDPHNPKTILSLIKSTHRLYPVGRLDKDSQGLILLTNDGALTQRLTHPKHHFPKIYQVTILGKVKTDQIFQLQKGVKLEEGLTKPCQVKIIKEFFPKKTIIEIVLFEGKKRQIRRMCAHLHLFVLKLERVAIGPIQLGKLAVFKTRHLTPLEINSLKKYT